MHKSESEIDDLDLVFLSSVRTRSETRGIEGQENILIRRAHSVKESWHFCCNFSKAKTHGIPLIHAYALEHTNLFSRWVYSVPSAFFCERLRKNLIYEKSPKSHNNKKI